MEEIWKDIKGYEGYYQVSNLGRVRSLDRQVNCTYNSKAIKHGKILKLHQCLDYKYIMLCNGNSRKMRRVHILVAQAFIPNPNGKKTVNHKNGNKFDNRVDNLEWCTHKENLMHAWKNNLNKRGEPKEIFQYSKSGDFIKRYESAKDASRQTKIDHGNICAVANGKVKRKTAGGYIWRWGKSISKLENEKRSR